MVRYHIRRHDVANCDIRPSALFGLMGGMLPLFLYLDIFIWNTRIPRSCAAQYKYRVRPDPSHQPVKVIFFIAGCLPVYCTFGQSLGLSNKRSSSSSPRVLHVWPVSRFDCRFLLYCTFCQSLGSTSPTLNPVPVLLRA